MVTSANDASMPMTGVDEATTVFRCRVCDASGRFATFRVREMMFGSQARFDYVMCPGCGCLQIAAIPDDLAPHYGPAYYSFAERLPHRGWRQAFARARNRFLSGDADLLGRVVAHFKPYLALASLRGLRLKRDVRIVDVGCGSGELLRALQDIGFDELLGVDPFIAADLDLGGGLRVLRAELASITGPRDVVMFHHSLEHMAEPLRQLQAAAALLAPGGCCVVRIPTVSSFAWREYGVDWCALDAPRHLYLHSVKSIRLLAERAGFRVERILSDSTSFQFWGSEQYRRGIALMAPGSHAIAPAPGAFTPAELRAYARRAAELNAAGDGDQIVVTLRRRA